MKLAARVGDGLVEPFVENVRKFADAGYDHVWMHQVGPEQDGFPDFCERELLPKLR